MTTPWPESLRQALFWVRQRYKSYPLLERLSTVVKPWLSTRTDNPIDYQPLRAVFTKPSNLWPCGSMDRPLVLHYSFFQPADNTIQRNRESKVQTVIKRIEEQVPGVKFNRVNDDSEAVIRIAFNHDGKTWSRVGREAERVNSTEPTMNLSAVRHESDEVEEGSREYGDIMQELFYSLGMDHEHQHSKRKFTISAIAVGTDAEYDEWPEIAVRNDIEDEEGIGAHSQPDMSFFVNYGERTKDGAEVKKNNKPIDLDFAWLNLVYPPNDLTKFEKALSESMDSRISKEERKVILKLYLDGEWEAVRYKILNVSNPKSALG